MRSGLRAEGIRAKRPWRERGLLGGGAFMGGQIVQDDDVARPGSRSQLKVSDVSFKNAPGPSARQLTKGGGQGVASQAGDEGLRLPVSESGLSKAAFAPSGLRPSQARHLGGRSGLVQKDQPVRLKPRLIGWRVKRPFLARLLYVEPIMLAGPQSFF